MTTPRQQRLAGSFGWDPSRRAAGSLAERVLAGIGADPAFTDDLLGDLAQEHARRTDEQGALSAGAWYAMEAVRAVPHLAWNVVHHGSAGGRVRVVSIAGAIVLVPALVVTLLVAQATKPVRLVVEGQHGRTPAEGLIVNSRHPVRLASTAFDARGHALGPGNVHFRWVGGDPLDVTPNGIVTCSTFGDASLQASAGSITTQVRVACRPVRTLLTYSSIQFVVGDSAMDLFFAATGPNQEPVFDLAGERFIEDTTVARLEHDAVRPLRPGFTTLVFRVGDAEAHTGISVLEPVASLAHLRPDQKEVIAPVHLAAGDTIRWPMPEGTFALSYRRESAGPLPSFRFSGPIMCLPEFGPKVKDVTCLARGPGAAVEITSSTPSGVTGRLAFERHLPFRKL